MTVDVPTPALLSLAGAALVAVTGYVVRALVLDRIRALEASRDKQGARLGIAESRLDAWDAVDEYKHRRRLTSGQQDETPP